MDRKQLITGFAVAVAVVGLWFGILQILKKTNPQLFVVPPTDQPDQSPSAQADSTPPASAPATQPAVAGVTTTAPATAPAPTVTVAPAPSAAISAVPAVSGPAQVLLGEVVPQVDKKSQYAMGVTLSPTGAAVSSVSLNRFGRADDRKVPYIFQQQYDDHSDSAAFLSRCVVINGTFVDLSQIAWTVAPGNDSTHAAFTMPLVDVTGKPVATLTKTYRLTPASNDPHTSQGYELAVDLSVQNQSGAPLSVQAAWNGPTMPPKENDRYDDRALIVANKTGPADIGVTQHSIAEFKASNPEIDLTKDKSDQPAVWAGECSAYFQGIVLPLTTSTTATKPPYTIKASSLNVDDDNRLVVMTFTSEMQTVARGQSLSMPTSVFLGPKWRDLLSTPYYSAYPRDYVESLIIHGSMCGFLTFNWLVWTLVALVRVFHAITFDWGLAIILLVCLVRLILHPITKRSQVSMLRMGKMGPEIERLKKKYGDDKDALNKAMMDVYKDQGPATLLGCLPMFLQMPIWIALWGALQSTFELRQATFLWGFTWIRDLSRPDAVLTWAPFTVPFVHFTISSLNILPILMGVVFYVQQKYTPKPPAATPEQAQQQKMMQYMSLLFPCFLYNGPSGLNLYILTSTTIGIFENRIIRNHIKQKEEAEKAGRVFVETKPTRASKQKDKNKPKDDGKKSKLGRWLSDLQQRADQLRTDADRAKKRRET
jgi:YidC/Oxa1 family membrane protein insertase